MMDFGKLQDPQIQAKLREAKTPDELLKIAGEEGLELSDEMLEGIAGGGFDLSNCKKYHCLRYFPQRPTDEDRLECYGFYLN